MAYAKRLSDYTISGGSGRAQPSQSQYVRDPSGRIIGNLGQFGYSGLVSGRADGTPQGYHESRYYDLKRSIYDRMENMRKQREAEEFNRLSNTVQLLGKQYSDAATALGAAGMDSEILKNLGSKLNQAISDLYSYSGVGGYNVGGLTAEGSGLKVTPLKKGERFFGLAKPVAEKYQPKKEVTKEPTPEPRGETKIEPHMGTYMGRRVMAIGKLPGDKLMVQDQDTLEVFPVSAYDFERDEDRSKRRAEKRVSQQREQLPYLAVPSAIH